MIKTKYPTTKPSLNLDFANTKSLDPRITFRRGTPGTYYDGVTHVKAEENLLSHSEDFSQWSKGDGSLVPELISDVNNTSPSGGDMYKLVAGTTFNTQHWYSSQNTTNNATFSVYAKAAGYNYIWIGLYGTSYMSIVADLTNGEFVSGGQDLDGVITSKNIVGVGDNWYRIDYFILSDSTFVALGGLSDPSTDIHSINFPQFTGDGTNGIYVWGAQLEQRDSVTAYTATNGTPITKYQPKLMTASPDHARFDHDPLTGESKGLLIEEQRTNLISYSEDFDDDYWTHPRADVYEYAIAPDGTSSANELVANVSASGGMSIYQQSVTTISSPFTVSCYFKKGDNDYAGIWVSDGSGSGANQYFDILNGTVESGVTYGSVSFTIDNASIQDVGNGWFRCSVTITTDATSVRPQFAPSLPTGDGSDLNCTIYETRGFLWGAQLEEGSFPTSYIKTTGASATRSADNASITGENFSSWYRQDEGSIYADILPNYAIHYGTAALSIGATKDGLSFSPGGAGQVRFFIRTNDTTQAQIDQTGFTENNLKLCAAYASNDAYFSVNGQTIGEDTSVLLPSVVLMNIGQDRFQSKMCAHIKKIAYYPQRLTNEQLQNLTK